MFDPKAIPTKNEQITKLVDSLTAQSKADKKIIEVSSYKNNSL